jgi:DNA-binding NarL/FixJ family response regulator
MSRVLIVDDHMAFRGAARRMLEAGGFDVVGEAEDAATAHAAVEAKAPDVVLLDVHIPGTDGIEIAEQLARRSDPPLVVLTSSRDADAYGERLANAPACGFIPKADLTGQALQALLARQP